MKIAFMIICLIALVFLAVNSGFLSNNSRVNSPGKMAKEKIAPLAVTVIDVKNDKTITYGELVDSLMQYGVIGVSEAHDSELHHRVQLQIIKSIYARDERLGVGMEMFQRPFQNVVDSYQRGEISEAEFLQATEYLKRWGYPFELYRPIVEFSRLNDIPIGALNASAELTRRVKTVGYDGLTDAEREELGPIDFNVQAHRDHWYAMLGHLHGGRTPTDEEKERSYQIMTIWDDYMAQNAAKLLSEKKLERIVIVAGIGHIDGGFGIPDRAAKYSGKDSVTVATVIGGVNDYGPSLPVDFIVCVNPDLAESGPCASSAK